MSKALAQGPPVHGGMGAGLFLVAKGWSHLPRFARRLEWLSLRFRTRGDK